MSKLVTLFRLTWLDGGRPLPAGGPGLALVLVGDGIASVGGDRQGPAREGDGGAVPAVDALGGVDAAVGDGLTRPELSGIQFNRLLGFRLQFG